VRRSVTAAIALFALCGAIAVARADPAPERRLVAILPLTTSSPDLAIYTRPVASALAGALADLPGARFELVSVTGVVPVQVALVIDGALARPRAGRIAVTLTLRDPERGVAVARLPTRTVSLPQLDRLVAQLAAELRPLIADALARGGAAAAPDAASASAGPASPPSAEPPRSPPPASPPSGASPPASAPRPRLLVLAPRGDAAASEPAVAAAATEEAHRLVDRLGYHPLSPPEGTVVGATPAPLAGRLGAVAALAVEVRAIKFSSAGVLTARGDLRVTLTAANGRPLLDRTIRTGTLVGNRGDRHAALVRAVLAQAMEIAAPRVRRALAR
jgi:hypothetical protein